MKKLLFVYLFLLQYSVGFAGKEFDILPALQDSSLWCWAASSEMVLDAYGEYQSQYDVANWAVDSINATNSISGDSVSVDQVLWHFGHIGTVYDIWTLLPYAIIDEIDEGEPIIAGIRLYNGQLGHVVVIRGYTGSGGDSVGNVIYNDPGTGTREVKPYDNFVKDGESWEWNETLRLTTPPRTPIPLGTDSNHAVWIDTGTTEITTSPQSLSYYAFKQGDTPVSWEWKLIFPHENGDAVVASWNINTTQSTLTWNIPNFVLPTNYDWKYSYSGMIGGRLEVVCYDPDYHDDAINVIYVPDDLYPGVLIYEGNTVSNTQPDVRAHEQLIVRNDLFQPGADIALMAGERIDIEDGVTIENGSFTSIMIDPLLR